MPIQRITSGILADGAILATDIADGIVTNAKLAGSITSDKITSVSNTALSGVVTASQLAANSVNASILQTNSVENYMATSGRPLSNRNLIINGAMTVAQRGISSTTTTNVTEYNTVDRWVWNRSSIEELVGIVYATTDW